MEKKVFFERLKNERLSVVAEEAMNYFTSLFMEVINGHKSIDNPFIVASLKIVTNELEKEQSLAQKSLVEHLVDRIDVIKVKMDEE